MSQYSRDDVLRILNLSRRHLTAWEREGLIPNVVAGEGYSFAHLSRLRALRELRSQSMSAPKSARNIRMQIDAMQQTVGLGNALAETCAIRRGSRLVFRHGGALLDPLTRQLAFDFTAAREGSLAVVQIGGGAAAANRASAREAARVQEMFAKAVHLEERAALDEAIRGYENILAIRPDHAAACINLGTIFYNRRQFARAEQMYRKATEADPNYALAFFDLGNVLDELQLLGDAIAAYERAIELVPQYADAHYNLALAQERQGQGRLALRHWMAYARLDPVGPWGAHAKEQARRLLALERIHIVSRVAEIDAAAS